MRSLRAPSLALTACLLAGACSSDRATVPTAPSGGTPPTQPQVAQFGGVWQGEYRVTACTGERHCVLTIGNLRPFLLRLEQAGSAVTGVLAGDVTVDVTGMVAATGELSLSGSYVGVSPYDSAGQVELRRFELWRTGDGLSGSIEYAVTYPPDVAFAGLPSNTSRSGQITAATRAPETSGTPVAPAFDGSWRGRFVVRDCVPVRWRDCYPEQAGHTYDTTVTLQQAGTAVAGTMRIGPYVVPLTGAARDRTVELTGELTTIVGGGRVVVRVTRWSGTRDSVGRLRGTFSYDDAYVQDSGGALSTQYEAELVSMVLRP